MMEWFRERIERVRDWFDGLPAKQKWIAFAIASLLALAFAIGWLMQ